MKVSKHFQSYQEQFIGCWSMDHGNKTTLFPAGKIPQSTVTSSSTEVQCTAPRKAP